MQNKKLFSSTLIVLIITSFLLSNCDLNNNNIDSSITSTITMMNMIIPTTISTNENLPTKLSTVTQTVSIPSQTPILVTTPVITNTPIAVTPNQDDWSFTPLLSFENWAVQLNISKNGKYIAFATYDGIYVYEQRPLRLLWHFLPDEETYSIAFSNDEKMLASGSDKLILWNLETGNPIKEINSIVKLYTTIIFSPDDRLLASGGLGGSVVTNLQTGNVTILNESEGTELALAFDPFGQLVVTSGFVELWEAATGKKIGVLYANTELGGAIDLVYFPNDERVVALFSEGTFIIIDVLQDEIIQKVYTKFYYTNKMDLAANGNLLAVGYYKNDNTGKIILWDMNNYDEVIELVRVSDQAAISDLKFSPDNKWLYAIFIDNSVGVWKIGAH